MIDPQRLLEFARGEKPAALVTVTATTGSTPRKAGASMVVVADGSQLGTIFDTIGGGAIEHRVRRAALEAIAETRPRAATFALTTELGMCCGGQMSVFIEPLRQRPPLVILGAGHVGAAMVRVADAAGFAVTVADPREELLTEERLGAAALIDGYEASDLDRLPFGPDCFCLVVTHDHPTDQALVEQVLGREFRYLAMIGSQRKATLMRERCLAKGIAPSLVDRVRSPAGLDIGAETPEEIAVSIVAEMVQVRRTEALAPAAGRLREVK